MWAFPQCTWPLWLTHSFLLFFRIPELHLKFDHGSLHLPPSVAGWSLSDDNWTRHQSAWRRGPIQANYPLLLGVQAKILPHRILEDCPAPGFYPAPEILPKPVLLALLLSVPPQLHCSHSHPHLPSGQKKSLLFVLLREIWVSLHELSFLPSLSSCVDYSIVTLYFTAIIHLCVRVYPICLYQSG